MTTTDTPPGTTRGPRRSGRPVVAILPAVGAAVVAAGVTTAVAAGVRGVPAADAALTGGLLAVAVLAFGTFSTNAVAAVVPRASLPIGLLTYLVQVVVVLAALVGLERSGSPDADLRVWVVGGVVATVLAWLAGHLWGALRLAPSRAEVDPSARVEVDARDC